MKTYRTELGLTQKALADAVEMTPTALIRYEQFIYQELSPKLASYFRAHGYPNAAQAYLAQRADLIEYNQRYLYPKPPLIVKPNEHPFITFRKFITMRTVGTDSRIAFCKLFLVHPSVIADYENCKLQNLPLMVRDNLWYLGTDYLDDLDELGVLYCGRHS